MRVRAVVGILAAALLAATPEAAAAETLTSVPLAARGSMTVVWHGDRDAGCEAAGLCDYSGSITYPSLRYGDLAMFGDRRRIAREAFGIAETEGQALVRVRREVAGGPPQVCVDEAQSPAFTLDVTRAYRDRYRLALGTGISPEPIASGRCAGPRLRDFSGSLPAAVFKPRRIVRRGTRVSLAGRFPFRAGPISGEVVSTVVLRSGRATVDQLGGFSGGGGRGPRVMLVTLRFDVTRATGELAADFRAVAPPACRIFDACGATGRESYQVASNDGELEVFGFAPAVRRVPKLRAALARVMRRGFLVGFGELARGSGRTTSLLSREGSELCSDRSGAGARPQISMFGAEGLVDVGFGGDDGFSSGPDVLRGRCPGPTQEEVLRGAPLAGGGIPGSALARRRLRLSLAGAGAFRGRAYRGTHKGQFQIDLERTRARVRVVRDGG